MKLDRNEKEALIHHTLPIIVISILTQFTIVGLFKGLELEHGFTWSIIMAILVFVMLEVTMFNIIRIRKQSKSDKKKPRSKHKKK